jgi:hypothetical protein
MRALEELPETTKSFFPIVLNGTIGIFGVVSEILVIQFAHKPFGTNPGTMRYSP